VGGSSGGGVRLCLGKLGREPGEDQGVRFLLALGLLCDDSLGFGLAPEGILARRELLVVQVGELAQSAGHAAERGKAR
jgi:hypothetical protein